MNHQTMSPETPVITAIVNRALTLGFALAGADEETLVLARSHRLSEVLEAIVTAEHTRLIVLEPRPSRRCIGTLVLFQEGGNPEQPLINIECDGEAAFLVLEDIAYAREQSH